MEAFGIKITHEGWYVIKTKKLELSLVQSMR